MSIHDSVEKAALDVEAQYLSKGDIEVVNTIDTLLTVLRQGTIKPFEHFTADELSSLGGELAAHKSYLYKLLKKMKWGELVYKDIIKYRYSKLRKKVLTDLKADGIKDTADAIKERLVEYTFLTHIKLDFFESKWTEFIYLWRGSNHMLDQINARIRTLLREQSDEKKFGEDSLGFSIEELAEKEENNAPVNDDGLDD